MQGEHGDGYRPEDETPTQVDAPPTEVARGNPEPASTDEGEEGEDRIAAPTDDLPAIMDRYDSLERKGLLSSHEADMLRGWATGKVTITRNK